MNQSNYGSYSNQMPSDCNQLVSLQKSMMQVWEQGEVQQYYQDIVLSFLDCLPSYQAEQEIMKQIKATHEGQSFFFKIVEKMNNRKNALNTLNSLIQNGRRKGKVDQKILQQICQQLNRLRNYNVGVAQLVIQLHKQYTKMNYNVSPHCKEMLINLDEDNSFLKESFLNKFIVFQQGYDPFFLHHYDMKGKRMPIQNNQIIDQLFNLSISYACKLFKTRTQVLDMLSSGKFARPKSNNVNKDFIVSAPFTTLVPNQQISLFRPKLQEEKVDERKKTSVNFRKKTLSLQNAKQKQKLQKFNQKLSLNHSPIINQKKFKYYVNDEISEQVGPKAYRPSPRAEIDHEYIVRRPKFIQSSEGQEYYKLVPINYRNDRKLSHRPIGESLKKTNPVAEQSERSISNYKKKLQPIRGSIRNIEPRQNDYQESQEQQKSYIKEGRKSQDSKMTNKPRKQIKTKEQIKEEVQSKNPVSLDLKKKKNGKKESEEKKDIKMRPGKFTYQDLSKYLRSVKFNQQLKKNTIQNKKWEQSILKCQSYLNQFLVNNEVAVIVLTLLLPDSNYLIKLWAPLQKYQNQISAQLFNKYLQYIQKMTMTKQIVYNGDQRPQLKSGQFNLRKQRIFVRKRVGPMPQKKTQFFPFFSMKCSNILFSQDNSKINLLYSQQIQCFSEINSFLSKKIAEIEKTTLNQNMQMLVKISQSIDDMKALNSLLQDQELDTYQVTSTLKMNQIKALRLVINTGFNASFIAGQGYFKLNGQQLFKNQSSLICRIACMKFNVKLYFGKGFTDCQKFRASIKKQAKPCEFSVKMFNKQLYGRIPNKDNKSNNCFYGNWQMSLCWQDELQGRVKHNMTNCEHFGPQSFFVGVQIYDEFCYSFQVKQQDFLF